MKTQAHVIPFPPTLPVYLAAGAIHNLIESLPGGTDYFIGVCLIVMMTGQLAQAKGSLVRAVFPLVCHLKWGWHRASRALERGKLEIDELFESSFEWSLRELGAEVVRIGALGREVQAVDSSTIARFRAGKRLGAAGKAYWGRAGKAVRANIVAALTSVVKIGEVRLGLVRRTRFGASCEAAIAQLMGALPASSANRLLVVDAGIATQAQFAEATAEDALLGRLRSNVKLRLKAGERHGSRGRFPLHGAELHPGAIIPEAAADETFWIEEEGVAIRLRRWREVHFEAASETVLDVVRVDDPRYEKPWLIGSTARELETEEFRQAYQMRTVIETNFYVGQDTCAMEQPRAFAEQAVMRRISLALLAGSLLKAIAARCEPMALGPWDRKPQRTAGRLAHYLSQRVFIFGQVALEKVIPRNYRKNEKANETKELQLQQAA